MIQHYILLGLIDGATGSESVVTEQLPSGGFDGGSRWPLSKEEYLEAEKRLSAHIFEDIAGELEAGNIEAAASELQQIDAIYQKGFEARPKPNQQASAEFRVIWQALELPQIDHVKLAEMLEYERMIDEEDAMFFMVALAA